MNHPPNDADVSRIEEIGEHWQKFDNTGDETVIISDLAEDIVVLPPGSEPIRGKTAIEEKLQAFPPNPYDVEHTSERRMISGDLAFDYISVEGSKLDEDGVVTGDVSLKGVDIYRRDEDGGWKCIIAIWNDQA